MLLLLFLLSELEFPFFFRLRPLAFAGFPRLYGKLAASLQRLLRFGGTGRTLQRASDGALLPLWVHRA